MKLRQNTLVTVLNAIIKIKKEIEKCSLISSSNLIISVNIFRNTIQRNNPKLLINENFIKFGLFILSE